MRKLKKASAKRETNEEIDLLDTMLSSLIELLEEKGIITQKEYEKRIKEIQRRGKLPRDVTNWQNASEYYNWLDSEVEKLKTLPSDTAEKIKINNGDWVTINPMYAKEHGQNNLNNKYKVITKTVNAKNLFTDGNSVHEWGYVENLNEGVDKIKSGKKLYYHGRKMG